MRKSLSGKRETSQLMVAVTTEVLEPNGIGRIHLRRIPTPSQQHLQPFVEESVDQLFYRLLEQAARHEPATYPDVIHSSRNRLVAP